MTTTMKLGSYRAGTRALAFGALGAVAMTTCVVGLTATSASAADGDATACSINWVGSQDITFSLSPENLKQSTDSFVAAVKSFEGIGIPVTAGITSFGRTAPLPSAPALLNQDINSSDGNAALVAQIESYTYDSTLSGSTNWQAGLQELLASAQAQGSKTAIFVTDGVPNTYTDASGSLIGDGGADDATKDAAIAAAAVVAQQFTDAGITLKTSFIYTNATGGGGLGDTMYPADPAKVTQAMQALEPGWSIDKVVSLEDLAESIKQSALSDCTPGTELTKTADLSKLVDNDGDGELSAGDQFPYNLDVKNTGNIPHTEGLISDEKLAALGVALSNAGKYGYLAPGGTTTLASELYTVTQADMDLGFIDNTANVVSQTPKGPVEDDDPERVPVGSAEVLLEKTADLTKWVDNNANGIVDAGDQYPYLLDVTNIGNVTHTTAVIGDVKLAAEKVEISNGGLYEALAPGGKLNFTTGLYTVTAEDQANGEVYNVATVEAQTANHGPVKDEDDDIVPLEELPATTPPTTTPPAVTVTPAPTTPPAPGKVTPPAPSTSLATTGVDGNIAPWLALGGLGVAAGVTAVAMSRKKSKGQTAEADAAELS